MNLIDSSGPQIREEHMEPRSRITHGAPSEVSQWSSGSGQRPCQHNCSWLSDLLEFDTSLVLRLCAILGKS